MEEEEAAQPGEENGDVASADGLAKQSEDPEPALSKVDTADKSMNLSPARRLKEGMPLRLSRTSSKQDKEPKDEEKVPQHSESTNPPHETIPSQPKDTIER